MIELPAVEDRFDGNVWFHSPYSAMSCKVSKSLYHRADAPSIMFQAEPVIGWFSSLSHNFG